MKESRKDRVKLLNLDDLEITRLNYNIKQVGVRECFLESLKYFPETYKEVSQKTGVNYRSLLDFSNSKHGLNFKNLLALANYVKGLMEETGSANLLDSFSKDDCFKRQACKKTTKEVL